MKVSVDVVIIGAGPYGLSLASHLRARGIEYRIFGRPMESWKANMPPGMLLNSRPGVSNLDDPKSLFTIKQFCTEQKIPYHPTLMAFPLESFVAYGEAFQQRFVPNVEPKNLIALEPASRGFRAIFDTGETIHARQVVLAVGMHDFKRMPDLLARLPGEAVSHSGSYGRLDSLKGKQVTIVGSGASASDLAALLRDQGTSVSWVARAHELTFARPPRLRSIWERLVQPNCGVGSGWTLKACCDAPSLFHMLPKSHRLRLANIPGRLGSATMKQRIAGKVPLFLGRNVKGADLRGGKVHLTLATGDGTRTTLETDHVIAATGYKIDVSRLYFLDTKLRTRIRCEEGAPVLSTQYESSVPGLFFVGPASAVSMGPAGRFVSGAAHASRTVARALTRRLSRRAAAAAGAQPLVFSILR